MKKASRIVIVGGGAAGLYAACRLSGQGLHVTLVERQARVGRKLLSTGNGRCNLTNLDMTPEHYRPQSKALEHALRALSSEDAIAFFEELGVLCVPDEAGRVYPLSNQAAGVLDALRFCASERGCEMRCEFDVVKIETRGGGFSLISEGGERLAADYVLLCCGGPAAPKLGGSESGLTLLRSLGHKIVPCKPGLTALRTEANLVRGLKGIRARAELTLVSMNRTLRREDGEILFSEDGVSGIAAMQLASSVQECARKNEKCVLRICLMPGARVGVLTERARLLSKRGMEDFLSGIVPKRLGQMLVKTAGLPMQAAAGDMSAAQLRTLEKLLFCWELPVRGTLGMDAAQISCGGAVTEDFCDETLESKRVSGLFTAGEILNVSGDCGGYNLHWAWASAELVVREIIKRTRE